MAGILASLLSRLTTWRRRRALLGQLDIGSGTRITTANLDGMFPELVHVGRDCVFAPASMALTHDASSYLHTGEYRVAAVHIGDNVFVGYGAVLMPGIRVGDGAIIGVRAVVTRDVPAGAVVAGVPARVVGEVSELIARRRAQGLVRAPFAGKSPARIGWPDIEALRTLVLSAAIPPDDSKC